MKITIYVLVFIFSFIGIAKHSYALTRDEVIAICQKEGIQACFNIAKRYAELGDAEAQFNVGNMYANALGVGKDFDKAIYWYQKSAEQGFVTAQYNLGVMYDDGIGVAQNKNKALYWYKKAADQGHKQANINFYILAKTLN